MFILSCYSVFGARGPQQAAEAPIESLAVGSSLDKGKPQVHLLGLHFSLDATYRYLIGMASKIPKT